MPPIASGRGSRGSAILPLLLLVVLAVPSVAAGPAPPNGVHRAAGLALTARPTQGPAPLFVEFSLGVPNGTSVAIEWSFGDGTWANGTGAALLTPSHEYLRSGEFRAQAIVRLSPGELNASVEIDVLPQNLSVEASVRPASGPVPLTVWLTGTASGGTETFVAYLWNFGDGQNGSGSDLEYTYASPGNFTATLLVTDSAGHSASSSVAITAEPNRTAESSGPGRPAILPAISGGPGAAAVLAVGGAGALVAAVVWTRSTRRSGSPRAPTPLDSRDPAALAPPGPVTTGRSPGGPSIRSSGGSEGPARAGSPEVVLPGFRPPIPAAPRRLSYELIVHLAALPRLGPADSPTREWTQAGIAEALGAGQSAVSKILRRLEAAGIVVSATAHVVGGARRVRVYRLTDRGERLGLAFRDRRTGPVPGGRPPSPQPASRAGANGTSADQSVGGQADHEKA